MYFSQCIPFPSPFSFTNNEVDKRRAVRAARRERVEGRGRGVWVGRTVSQIYFLFWENRMEWSGENGEGENGKGQGKLARPSRSALETTGERSPSSLPFTFGSVAVAAFLGVAIKFRTFSARLSARPWVLQGGKRGQGHCRIQGFGQSGAVKWKMKRLLLGHKKY